MMILKRASSTKLESQSDGLGHISVCWTHEVWLHLAASVDFTKCRRLHVRSIFFRLSAHDDDDGGGDGDDDDDDGDDGDDGGGDGEKEEEDDDDDDDWAHDVYQRGILVDYC